jgi:hypothetical protein
MSALNFTVYGLTYIVTQAGFFGYADISTQLRGEHSG